MASDPANRHRGRPSVFTERVLEEAAPFSYARRVRTRRGAQDLVYRKFAVAAIELYGEAYPEKAEVLSWLLRPKLRHSLLSELGRIGYPRSGPQGDFRFREDDVSRLVHAALWICHTKPSTKKGVAMLRSLRRGLRSHSLPRQVQAEPAGE